MSRLADELHEAAYEYLPGYYGEIREGMEKVLLAHGITDEVVADLESKLEQSHESKTQTPS